MLADSFDYKKGHSYRWTEGRKDGRMEGRKDGRTDGRMDGRMEGLKVGKSKKPDKLQDV
jgi:predicted transposase YdaD